MAEPAKATITDLHVSREDDFGEAVLQGLGLEPKCLYPRLLYDERGSFLFEKICEQPEYYPTRLETEILQMQGRGIVGALKREVDLVELGSGNSQKTRILLDFVANRQKEFEYRPIDISGEILRAAADEIQTRYNNVKVHGFVADFLSGLDFLNLPTPRPKLIMILGSNLGNFDYPEAAKFLGKIRRSADPEDRILIGFDLDKDPGVLERAYNDAAGYTEEFILNLLDRINRELGGDFDRDAFRYHAFYHREANRVELYLVSRRRQEVFLQGLNRAFRFRKGERIQMEYSCKFTPARLEWIADEAGLRVLQRFSDSRNWYSLILFEVDPAGSRGRTAVAGAVKKRP